MSRSMFEKAWNYVMNKREKAPICSICKARLFDGFEALDDYFYNKRNIYKTTQEEMKLIYDEFFRLYPYQEEKTLSRHHVNYAKNIQIPVCKSCHSRIHGKADPDLHKYLPVDKKPKNQGGFDSNMYKPLH